MIRSHHYTSPFKQPIQTITIDSDEPVKDAFIFLRAKEFFKANPKETEVRIEVPSREILILIDREHPEVN